MTKEEYESAKKDLMDRSKEELIQMYLAEKEIEKEDHEFSEQFISKLAGPIDTVFRFIRELDQNSSDNKTKYLVHTSKIAEENWKKISEYVESTFPVGGRGDMKLLEIRMLARN